MEKQAWPEQEWETIVVFRATADTEPTYERLRAVLDRVFAKAGVDASRYNLTYRGDDAVVLVPAGEPSILLMAELPGALLQELELYNAAHPSKTDVQLVIVLELPYGSIPDSSEWFAIVADTVRILDSPAVQSVLQEPRTAIVVIATGEFHRAVLVPNAITDPQLYQEIPGLPGWLRVLERRSAPVGARAKLARDYWTVEDLLEYQPYADAIAAFIRHRDSKPPLTIGVKGPWGSGKTSLMRMIQADLDPTERPITLSRGSRQALTRGRWARADTQVTNGELLRHAGEPSVTDPLAVERPEDDWRATVWFNPWMYQSSEQVWAGLSHAIISQVTDRLQPGDRERFWLELNLARLDRLAIRRRAYRLILERLLPFTLALLLAVGASAVLWISDLAHNVARWGLALGPGAVVIAAAASYLRFRRERAIAGFQQLLAGPATGFDTAFPDPGYLGKTGFLHLVHADMTRVLKLVATEDRPLVVFVDDLDRCSPKVVAEVIEAINLFLAGEFENCMFVLAMEPEAVVAHVEVAYAGLAEKLGGTDGALGWRFLEKIVQLPISLPPVNRDRHLPAYLRALLGLPGGSKSSPAATRPAEDAGHQPYTRQAETYIRNARPSLDELPELVQQLKRSHPTLPSDAVQAAADRVFADLYSDTVAYEAIEAALPALRSTNPREIKRYMNLFRFYSFITLRQRIEGTAPDNAQLAKLAALAIRWPDLLGPLSNEGILEQLEAAAGSVDGEQWEALLTECGCRVSTDAVSRRSDLQAVLATEPKIHTVASGLL